MKNKIFEYISIHLYGLNLGTPGEGLSWTTKPNSSEEEGFFNIFMYFYGLNLGPPAAGPSWNLGPSFEQTW